MGKQILNIIKEQGFCVAKNVIDVTWIDKLNSLQSFLIPQRGHDFNAKYYPRSQLGQAERLAIWWSQQVVHWPGAEEINKTLLKITQGWFANNCIYVADVINNEAGNSYVKPHIDSPYRFDQWHDDPELLGVQCIVPLCHFNQENGGTGLYPGSHLKNWIVKESYRGVYTEEFLANVVQPEMAPGDVLIYNPRVLHSTMPNHTTVVRRALLSHVTTIEMVKKLKLVDNIWLE